MRKVLVLAVLAVPRAKHCFALERRWLQLRCGALRRAVDMLLLLAFSTKGLSHALGLRIASLKPRAKREAQL